MDDLSRSWGSLRRSIRHDNRLRAPGHGGRMLYDADHTVGTALEYVRARISEEMGYPAAWLDLEPLQREVARALAPGMCRPFSRSFRESAGTALGEEAPSAARVQAALRKLNRLGIAGTARGEWGLADPGFGHWIVAGEED